MRVLRICGSLALVILAGAVWFSTSSGVLPASVHSGAPVGPLLPGSPFSPITPLSPVSRPRSHPARAPRPSPSASTKARSRRVRSPGWPGPSKRPPASPSPSPSPVPDQAQLQAALLTAAQLPDGSYTAEPAAADVGLGSLKYCPALSAGQSGVTAQASVSFNGGETGPDISEGLFQDTVRGAEQMLGAFKTVPSSCGSFSAVVDGISLAITVGTVSLPAIGDQTATVQVNVTLTAYDVTISGDVAAIRHGGTVIVVTNVAYPTLDQGLTQAVAAAAYKKAASLW
jgi:hypothetical protein